MVRTDARRAADAGSASRRRKAIVVALQLALCLCAQVHAEETIRREDMVWLQRIGFGVDSADVARFRQLGRRRYLDAQLDPHGDGLPAPIRSLIGGYEVERTPTPRLLAGLQAEQQRIKAMPDGEARGAAKKAQQQHANELLQQAQQAVLLRAVYGTDQLREQMVWFWLNHFSVYGAKGRVRWVAADYADHAIRPHALGKFRDLVLATLESPAMLEFLDNAQNAKGKVNENYARELMELHVLGVGSGYTQADVQQLALVLTGSGVAPLRTDARAPARAEPRGYVRKGLFAFKPARHDFSDKMLLGKRIRGRGFDEVGQAVDLITRQPACAQFISRKLAQYFVADDPPKALVDAMARTFRRSDGDITQVLRTLFESRELVAKEGGKFKDPMQFLVSSVRLAYDGRPIANAKPLLGWLNQLGEPLFGRATPDGWPLDAASWASSGQMAKRFEIARAIGSGNNPLFTPEDGTVPGGFPQLATRLYYDTIDTRLAASTRVALAKATSQQEWNTFLLASPDLNYR